MLPVEERLLLDIIRMIAYRAETRMMQPLVTGPGQGPQREETAPRLAHIRCRCHPRTRSRNPARPVPRSRQRSLRAEPRSPHQRTQPNPHQVSRHGSNHLLRTAALTAPNKSSNKLVEVRMSELTVPAERNRQVGGPLPPYCRDSPMRWEELRDISLGKPARPGHRQHRDLPRVRASPERETPGRPPGKRGRPGLEVRPGREPVCYRKA